MNCRRVSEQELDETEFLNVEKHKADEIEELIRSGDTPINHQEKRYVPRN